jgi:hypothetical protein
VIGETVEAGESRPLVQIRPGVPGDDERAEGEVDLGLAARDETGEPGPARGALVIDPRTPIGHRRILVRD